MFKQLTIKRKLLLFIPLLIVLIISTTIFFSYRSQQHILEDVGGQAMDEYLKGIVDRIELIYRENIARVSRNLDRILVATTNRITLDEQTTYKARITNQVTKESIEVTLPTLKLDTMALHEHHEWTDAEAKNMKTMTTVFQLIPEGMVRITTSVKNDKGERAVNTFIPTESPVYKAIAEGKDYTGMAIVVGKQAVTSYRPILNAQQKVIGAIFAGIYQDNMDEMKRSIQTSTFRKTGYPYVLDQNGVLLVHPKLQGQNLYETKDVRGFAFIREIIERKNGTIRYYWENKNNNKIEEKMTHFRHIPEMNWYVAVGVTTEEFFEQINETRNMLLFLGLLAMLVGIGVAMMIARDVVKVVDGVNQQTQVLTDAAMMGDLQKRADETKIGSEFRPIIKGINTLLNKILSPIQDAQRVMKEFSQGNLKVVMSGDYRGDLAVFKDAINNSISSVAQLIAEVGQTVEQVQNGSSQVATASQSLAQGASEQASSLEEISSSMGEIGGQTNKNAENAGLAKNLSEESKNNAALGNDSMKKMITAMGGINDSSQKISKIIKVIDEIAFQTNLLALNAAVEAARAGKHGKGFAVVAEEVRNLAARSAKAAKETTDMIQESTQKVIHGTSITNETAKALEIIHQSATKVSDLVGEIAIASNDQAKGVSQIVTALGQIDQVTQRNTASAEESASASEELSGQAQHLKTLIAKFQVDETKPQ